MGAAAPPELAAAVSEAGALGMLGTARPGLTAITFADLLDQVRSLTDRPFGVNFIVAPVFLNGTSTRPPLDLKCIEIAARAAKVVEFFYGEPERRFVEMAHAAARWPAGRLGRGRRQSRPSGRGATSSLRRARKRADTFAGPALQ